MYKTRIKAGILSLAICISLTSCSLIRRGQVQTNNGREFDGTLEKLIHQCSVPGPTQRSMYVYLPATYYTSDRSYPVLYMLHGANGNETSWIRKGRILESIDSLVAIGEIDECIYVFPNTNHYYNDYDYADSREKKSIDAFFGLNGNVEYAFADDVVAYIDRFFRTLPDKSHRAIGGLSLGGLQALYISANYDDMFGYIGLFSPIIYPPFRIGAHNSFYRNLESKLDRQFDDRPSVYQIMAGKDDIYYNSAYFYSQLLEDLGYIHSFHSTSGGHSWTNWKRYSVSFLKELWRD